MEMKDFSLEGKVALVTGASYGIGFAIAEGMAKAGATIVFNDIRQELVDKGLAAYREAGVEAHGYVCDVTDEDAVQAMVKQIAQEVGVIDILVNNAGIIKRIPMCEMTAAQFRQVVDVDLNAPFIVSKAVIPGMIEKGHGKIINICSMMSELGRETVSAYAAAKGGLKMLTKNIASEYGEYNIQCNGIGPGYIETPQTAPLRERQADGSRHPFDQFIIAKTPAARWGTTEDLVGPAVFLASDASNFVNGHVLYVDGGILAYIGKQPKEPDEQVSRCDGNERERYADFHKIPVGDRVALLAQDADARDVGACADGRQVAAQGRACQQPKIEQIRLHAHECGNAAHHRQHRCHIRDVVNKCGEKHRSPYDERIDGKQVVSRDVDKQAADGVDDTRPRDARDDDEQARQQKQRLAVRLTEELPQRSQRPTLTRFAQEAHGRQQHTDDPIGHSRLFRHKGNDDKQSHRRNEQKRGDSVRYLCALTGFHRLAQVSEVIQQHARGCHGTHLYHPKNPGPAAEHEEIKKIHAGIAAQQNGCGISHQRGRALQIGGHRNGDDDRHRADVQLFGQRQRHRRDHQHCGHIVHESGDQPRKQGKRHHRPFDVGHFFHNDIRHQRGHA